MVLAPSVLTVHSGDTAGSSMHGILTADCPCSALPGPSGMFPAVMCAALVCWSQFAIAQHLSFTCLAASIIMNAKGAKQLTMCGV